MDKKITWLPCLGKKKKSSFFSIIKWALTICLIGVCLWFLFCVKNHRIEGQSMEPTLKNNERMFIIKGKNPKRHEIITFKPKDEPRTPYVKRVIGTAGDKIKWDQQKLVITPNHKEVKQKHPLFVGDFPNGITEVAVSKEVARLLKDITEIPENKFFVLGDNRKNSRDSRQLGLIDRKQIEGTVKYRYYPITRLFFFNE